MEKEIAVRYFYGMDLFSTLKSRNELLIERMRSQIKREGGIRMMNDLAHHKVTKTGVLLNNMKRRMELQFRRIFRRSKWLSLQYYSLASLINLYLAILEAQTEQTRHNRIQKFTNRCTTILKRYKKPVFKKYRKILGRKKRQEPSISSIEKAALLVYGELKSINKLYQRRIEWRRVILRVRSLLGGGVSH